MANLGLLYNSNLPYNSDLPYNGVEMAPGPDPVPVPGDAIPRGSSHIIEVILTAKDKGTPHFAVPFRIEAGRVVTIEEDDLAEVAQNVAVILGTFLYERPMKPDFGIDPPLFGPAATEPDPDALEGIVGFWEDRALIEWGDSTLTEDGALNFDCYVAMGSE